MKSRGYRRLPLRVVELLPRPSLPSPLARAPHKRSPADLGTGVYHWFVDNYGDGSTPVFGRQIEAFQGHHARPWTITERQFANNVALIFKPLAAPAALFLLASPFAPTAFSCWIASFMWFVGMSQQFHAWSHMRRSELPEAVLWLQASPHPAPASPAPPARLPVAGTPRIPPAPLTRIPPPPTPRPRRTTAC